MNVFEFVITLYSIVIALSVARILTGYAALIEHRATINHLPLFVIWLSLLFLAHIAWWFSLWNRSEQSSFSLAWVIVTLHVPAFLFIACNLLVPGESARESMSERYEKMRIPFLVCLAVALIFSPLMMGINTGNWAVAAYLVPIGVLLLVGTASANIRLQYFVASTALLIDVAFAFSLRSNLAA
jgi:hypothetical protein